MKEVKEISYKESIEFLLPRHYSGRKPQICFAFGWYFDGVLKAVCTFGKPPSPAPPKAMFRGKYIQHIYELNRLCREEDLKEPLSQFLGECLRKLKSKDLVILSYADTGMNHNGYVYQACNFIYTGKTKQRNDPYLEGNKHARHGYKATNNTKKVIRTPKHRYVYFCTKNKKLKKEWLSLLSFPIESYPKDENKNYTLGTFLQPQILDKSL